MALRFGIFDQLEQPGGVPMHQLYADHIEMVVKAEQAGFWGYHKSEHHMIPLDAAPSINLYLAAVAQHTSRIRLCSLVHLLPFYHPLRLAEELCMLDHLSLGRFEFGYGKGISIPEHILWGLTADEAVERTEEALDIVLAAMQCSGEDFDYDGRFWSFAKVPIEFAPYQRPYMPLWRPGTLAAAAEQGVSTMAGGPLAMVAKAVADYQAIYQPGTGVGRHHTPTVGGIRRIYVAPTDAEAEARARAAWANFSHNLTKLFRRYEMTPPNDPTLGGDFDKALAVEAVVVGSPQTMREHVERFAAETGTDYFVGTFAWGDIIGDDLRRSFDLFAEHVALPLAA
ncbi:MAG: LLM class flavin-dependent oxidoreductase [Acidimicrobiia bacterium]|nr:LLM class flavin-dependent oxidoreductase [Acidimicrobiia bacterium]